ncbi:hypothetical protein ZEAMMB73_Zm00001d003523 [Zea mays]|uniref:ATP-dependent rRNA helicase SPB4-like C-terminal extension domain-containing protein n=1 Tax=Zea mays TaxID=4577 RepID=A0A1D6E9N0_MAIZE|nr:hypothetical protein ZEAMMB73_Zm00001d003523 [Zea mays]
MDEWIRQAEVWVRQSESWIRQQPPEQIYVAATVVAVTILLLIVGAVPNLELPMVLTVLKCCICIENIHSAKEAYRSYVLAYDSHSMKDIFNVHQLDLQMSHYPILSAPLHAPTVAIPRKLEWGAATIKKEKKCPFTTVYIS